MTAKRHTVFIAVLDTDTARADLYARHLSGVGKEIVVLQDMSKLAVSSAQLLIITNPDAYDLEELSAVYLKKAFERLVVVYELDPPKYPKDLPVVGVFSRSKQSLSEIIQSINQILQNEYV